MSPPKFFRRSISRTSSDYSPLSGFKASGRFSRGMVSRVSIFFNFFSPRESSKRMDCQEIFGAAYIFCCGEVALFFWTNLILDPVNNSCKTMIFYLLDLFEWYCLTHNSIELFHILYCYLRKKRDYMRLCLYRQRFYRQFHQRLAVLWIHTNTE